MKDKAPAWGDIIDKGKDEFRRSIDEAIERQITLLNYRASVFQNEASKKKTSGN